MNIYYIYFHLDGDEIVYIGKGMGGRAWSTERCGEEHIIWANDLIRKEKWASAVRIIKFDLDESSSYKLEKELIEKYQPKFNERFVDIYECKICGFVSKSKGGITSHIRNKHQGDIDKYVTLKRKFNDY